MKNKITTSLILSAFILLGANTYYVMINIPPDGRWKLQIPITSFFILIYLVIFFIINKKLSKNIINYFSILIFNIILSIMFLLFAKKIEIFFQDVSLLYFNYIPLASYIIILGLGIVIYKLLITLLEKNKFFTEIYH